MTVVLLLLLTVNDHAAVALEALPELHILLLFGKELLVALQQLLSQLHNFVACHSYLLFHVCDEQVLVKLVNI